MSHDEHCEQFGFVTQCYCDARANAEADLARIRNELRDRLDRCDPFDHEAALRQLAHRDPDLVNEALDTTGAPQ